MSPGVHTAGKHLMPRLNAAEFASDARYRERIVSYVRDLGIAGFCLFGGGEVEVKEATTSLQEIANGQLLFSADCEFGLPMRFTSGTEFPDAMAIAKTGDPNLARKVGEAIAKEMKSLGLGWNFAPVADVNSNPDNPIINTRAFGDDVETVSKYAVAYMQGLQSQGVLAAAKHFPGHGDTSVDSHRALPYLDGDLDRFDRLELAPFKAMIDARVDSIMTGHLATPQLLQELGSNESTDLPATLSETISTKLLRHRLGFQGIIVTDALEMKAIHNAYGDADAARMAFEAGADIVLMPPDVEAAYHAIAASPVLGRRSHSFPVKVTRPMGNLSALAEEHLVLALEVGRRSIHITGHPDLNDRELVVLTDQRPEVQRKSDDFTTSISSLFKSVQKVTVGGGLDINSRSVLAVFHRARGYIDADATEWTIPRIMRDVAGRFAERGDTLAGLILFGNPYLDRHFRTQPSFVLKTFSESAPSIQSASELLRESHRSR